MMILGRVRNYIPSHDWVSKGGWNIADCVARSYDVEGMHVGTVAAGRIGLAVLKRLKPFDMHLHYTDRHRLAPEVETELGLTWHDSREEMYGVCDVVTLNVPLHSETEHMINDERSEEHTSELQSLMRISYAVFCLKKKKHQLGHKNRTERIHTEY